MCAKEGNEIHCKTERGDFTENTLLFCWRKISDKWHVVGMVNKRIQLGKNV